MTSRHRLVAAVMSGSVAGAASAQSIESGLWWATRRWKASITCGDLDLDRDGLDGNTRTWRSRIQWIY